MKKILFLIVSSMIFACSTHAGTLRVPDGMGETSDYDVTSASLRKGIVTIEASKYKRSIEGILVEIDRKFFSINGEILKNSGIDSGSLISIIMNKDFNGDVFCTVQEFSNNRSNQNLICADLVVSARKKE